MSRDTTPTEQVFDTLFSDMEAAADDAFDCVVAGDFPGAVAAARRATSLRLAVDTLAKDAVHRVKGVDGLLAKAEWLDFGVTRMVTAANCLCGSVKALDKAKQCVNQAKK